jgi:hypothetical protein
MKVVGARDLDVRPGATITLRATATDPDKNRVRAHWWQYADAGTYPGDVTIADPYSLTTAVRVPPDAMAGQTIHIVLEGTDDGTPALTRYQRVILTVR